MKTSLVYVKTPRRFLLICPCIDSVTTSPPLFRRLVLKTAAAGSDTCRATPQYDGGSGQDVHGGRGPERVQVTRGVAVPVHVTWVRGPVIVVAVNPNVTCVMNNHQD